MTLQIDWNDAANWMDDETYSLMSKHSIYICRTTCKIFPLFESDDDTDGGISAEENAAARESITANPSQFVQIPLPSHETIHSWFRDFLAEHGCPEAYYPLKSIGGCLKELDDDGTRSDWAEYRQGRAAMYAKEIFESKSMNAT